MQLAKLGSLIAFSILLIGAAENAPIINATVDKTRVLTGESFTYTIVVEGIFQDPKLILPEFKNFKVTSRNQSQNYSFTKGAAKINIKLIYLLFAFEPGEFDIDPVTVKDGEKEYKSSSVTIIVEGKPFKDKQKIRSLIEEGLPI